MSQKDMSVGVHVEIQNNNVFPQTYWGEVYSVPTSSLSAEETEQSW